MQTYCGFLTSFTINELMTFIFLSQKKRKKKKLNIEVQSKSLSYTITMFKLPDGYEHCLEEKQAFFKRHAEIIY